MRKMFLGLLKEGSFESGAAHYNEEVIKREYNWRVIIEIHISDKRKRFISQIQRIKVEMRHYLKLRVVIIGSKNDAMRRFEHRRADFPTHRLVQGNNRLANYDIPSFGVSIAWVTSVTRNVPEFLFYSYFLGERPW